MNNKSLLLHYQEKKNELEHSFEPWQQTNYTGKGIVWSNAANFIKSDTLARGQRTYYSITQWNESTLLFLDYGDKDLFAVTKGMFEDQVFAGARYSPIALVDYFVKQKAGVEKESDKELVVYKLTINKTIVKLFIRKSDHLLHKVTTLGNDELFGDVLTTYVYKNYKAINNLSYPALVEIEKINGKVKDEVVIPAVSIVTELPALLNKPANYKFKDEVAPKPEIKVEKYSDNIHFIELKHTDDKVMVVEFNDFLLAAEAPLNSMNGELIINEAKKIAPNKPIKYFVFSHYHPHYTGGMRPFVHKGATVFSTKADVPYLQYLASAPHTLEPDSLQLHPKPLQIEEINESKTVTDGKFEMKIFFIGNKSQHTNDYLIYYFPSEQLLFEGDLVWIARQGEIKKAGTRQAGLYNAMKELGLNVKTIIQSWPVKDYGVKTVIPFADLEQSMK
ncbi:MAG: hypothetical protein JSS93_12355 [Bacteroidetes bacterium]|nr:hypothetical protein [Bacteroidota bacterium]